MIIPHFSSTTIAGRRVLVDSLINPQTDSIVLDSTISDGSATPTHRIRPGNVVTYDTDGKNFLEATDSSADVATAAAVATLITNPGSGGWDGNVVISGHWGSITVALSGANTDAAVAAAIIAAVAAQNPETQARITAADTTGEVTITNFDVGDGTWLKAVHSTVAAMFGASGQEDAGTDPDVRVTLDYVDLKDEEGTAIDGAVLAARSGHFDASNLINLTAQARAILKRRGAKFDDE